jgi:hypothetical protein
METKNAFPTLPDASDGMTLRDWFAGQIIGTIYRELEKCNRNIPANEAYTITEMAGEAYRVANAMMEEREK